MSVDRLSATFAALADPTRRAILARLASGQTSVNELAKPFRISLPAVSRHLKVLERSGLIARSRVAQRRPCRLKARPLKEAVDWLEHYRRFWEQSLDRLDEYLKQLQTKEKNMSKQNEATEDYSGREFVMTRELAAPRALVFKAWTDAKHIAQWWGPKGFTNPVCEWDARPGQAIHVVMRAPNGIDYPMGGEFREIAAPERLVFTSGALDEKGSLLFEFLHTVTLAERGGKTILTIASRVLKTTAEANKYIGGFEAGMTQSLERLAKFLESQPQ